jgi:hypothetical protein|tara:strand:+ start:587 stop:1351 length:765 start_codon:yes stop_codon:yes gene_type:complete
VSREALTWATQQTDIKRLELLVLMGMGMLARGWEYHTRHDDKLGAWAGYDSRSIQRAREQLRYKGKISSPTRRVFILQSGEFAVQEATRVSVTEESETTQVSLEDDSKEVQVSPILPSITPSYQETSSSYAPTGEQSTFPEIPDWVNVVNETADFCGGEHLKSEHIPKLIEKAESLDLLDEAHKFDSHHRAAFTEKPYKTFATYLRFSSTWIPNALERNNGTFSQRTPQTNAVGQRAPRPGEPSPTLGSRSGRR